MRRLREILDAYPLSDVKVVATNTLRIATNASEFLQDAEKVIGYPIEVISGEEEARLIYLGVANVLARPEERRLVIDIGGGSTELIYGKGQEIVRAESFSVGTVRQSLAFFHDGIIDEASFEAAILSARSQFEDAVDYYRSCGWTEVYGSSGTIRATAEILAMNGIGDGRMTLENLELLKKKLIEAGHINKAGLDGVKTERASSILGGLTILIVLTKDFGIDVIKPIEAGLRMGIMWDIYLQETQKDRREEAIRDMLRRYGVDEQRAIRVADYALAIYKQLGPEADKFLKQLYWSALLHEIGHFRLADQLSQAWGVSDRKCGYGRFYRPRAKADEQACPRPEGQPEKIEWSADQYGCTESGCRAETGGHASACKGEFQGGQTESQGQKPY